MRRRSFAFRLVGDATHPARVKPHGIFTRVLPLLALLLGVAGTCSRVGAGDLRVATFTCEVTPPIGHPLCGGWIRPLEAVDDPLLAKGVVLADGDQRYVLCAVDWCLLQTGAYEAFRDQLAAGAQTSPARVAVHTVHQHNAPIADSHAERLLRQSPAPPAHLDLEFLTEVTARLADAAREALPRLEPFNQVGFGRAKVDQFASNRRVRRDDGSIQVRYSSTRDPELHAAPEGLIDPWLRTLAFCRDDRPLVELHYYATHPMSYYGDGRATADTVGLARERREREQGIPQIYFTGCAGNITAGKYNDGSPEARIALTERVWDAMNRASAVLQKVPVNTLSWRTAQARFFPRPESRWSETTARRTIADPAATAQQRLGAALNLAWIERFRANPHIEISCLRIGPVFSVHLPAEAFIEYQLHAQNLAPHDFVAVAAYGESGPGYICTDVALGEGGYEPTASRVGAPTEIELKRAIAELLGAAEEFQEIGH